MDSVCWKEFKVSDVLTVEQTKSIVSKDKLIVGNIPYVTRTAFANGISCTCGNIEKINKGNCITIGAESGIAFYQSMDFVAGNKIYRLSKDGLTEKEYLYLTSVLNKKASDYSYSNARIPEKIKNEIIKLPAKKDGTPDWDYMAERIKELEAERIKELEAERIKELEAYLIASGLDDYELTEEDKQVLAKRVEWKEFKADELFRVISAHRVLSKLQLSNDGLYPAYSSDTKNNGIIGYCKEPEFIIDKTHPCYVVFGDHTRTMNIVKESFSVLDNVKVLVPPITNDKVLLFLITVWKKCIPNKGYARHWTEAKKCILRLPVRNDNQPDWDYMERYIRAIEKQVIANAVKWKDQQIATTKQIVDKSIA